MASFLRWTCANSKCTLRCMRLCRSLSNRILSSYFPFWIHKYHSLTTLLILVASTRHTLLTLHVSLRLARRPSTQFANSTNKVLQTRFTNKVLHSSMRLVELYTKLVFSGRYRLVFLGIYHTVSKGNLGWYFWYRMYKKYVFTVSK